MVLTHAIFDAGLDLEVFASDTGRAARRNAGVLDAIRQRYGRGSRSTGQTRLPSMRMWPRMAPAFYESVELRKACCQIRKVERSSARAGRTRRLDHRAAAR